MGDFKPEEFQRRKPGGKQKQQHKAPVTGFTDERGLDLKRQIFIQSYSDPASRGYQNATESFKIASPHVTHSTARTQGPLLMREPEVRSAIEEEFHAMGFGTRLRLQILKKLAEDGTAETLNYNEEGKMVQRSVYQDRKSQLRALDISFRLDGSYDKAAAIGAVTKQQITRTMAEYEKRMMREIRERNVTPRPVQSEQSATQPLPDEPPQSAEQTPPSSLQSDPLPSDDESEDSPPLDSQDQGPAG